MQLMVFFLALMARHNSIRRLSQVEITKHVVYGLKNPIHGKQVFRFLASRNVHFGRLCTKQLQVVLERVQVLQLSKLKTKTFS